MADGGIVNTVEIDRPPVRMTSGNVETFDATGFAEKMPRSSRIEAVIVEIVCAVGDAKLILRRKHMDKARLDADATIAAFSREVRRAVKLKLNSRAVTPALVCNFCHRQYRPYPASRP